MFSSFAHSGFGVSYTCAKVAEGLARSGIDTQLHVPWRKGVPCAADVRPAMPAIAGRLLKRRATRRQETQFFDALMTIRDPRRFAYLWPDASIGLIRALHEARIPIVREMINCHVATCRRILDDAYGARGLGRGPIGDAHLAYEAEMLALADRIVAPGPGVADSLIENGVPEAKIVRSTYAWERARVPAADPPASAHGLTYLFVGTLCVRKGVDTLVRAWRHAGVDGRLVLLGAVDPPLARFVAANATGDVVHVPFSRSVAAHYARADVFVMPALEEGGPLVSYEALGAGLPVIGTAMGGGFALEDGVNGIRVPPEDEAALAAAIRTLADDRTRRHRYAAASRALAARFTWEEVGARRAAALAASLFG